MRYTLQCGGCLVFSGQVKVAVLADPFVVALGEECVQVSLGGVRSVTRCNYRSLFKHWLLWLSGQHGWVGKMPSELLDFQENATGRQQKLLLGLMKQFVQWKGGTYVSMIVKLSHIRSFFTANGVDIQQRPAGTQNAHVNQSQANSPWNSCARSYSTPKFESEQSS